MWECVIELVLSLLFEVVGEACPRFCACSLTSLAAAGFIVWLAPTAKFSHLLCALIIAVGVGTGILWERSAR